MTTDNDTPADAIKALQEDMALISATYLKLTADAESDFKDVDAAMDRVAAWTRTTSLAAQDGLVKHMANRFLGWKLPENFSPDAGISFKPTFNDHLDPPMRNNPIGTNLFNATQAEEMVRYMLEGFHQ